LDHAHERDVVHGDLHPRRVGFTADGRIGIMGFGEYPSSGDLIGNVSHLAPELRNATEPACTQSDIYGLGRLASYLPTGRVASREEAGAKDSDPSHRPLSRPSQAWPDLSAAAGLVIERALALRPQDRFAKAGHFVRTLTLALHANEPEFGPAEEETWRGSL